MNEILIWDSADPATDICKGKQSIVFWQGYSTYGLPDSVSIPWLVEEHAESLRKRYLAWIYEVGETVILGKRLVDHVQLRSGFSAWWMSLLAEKCNFSKSPQIDDAVRLLAFTDWMDDRNTERVALVSSNAALAECLQRWCRQKGIGFEWRRGKDKTLPVSRLRRLYARLPHALQALMKLESENGIRYDIVVMVQGDEPMTRPEMIAEAVQPMLDDSSILVVNLLGEIKDTAEFEDRNCIKVVCDLNRNAIYFSREPILTRFTVDAIPVGKQVCIIPFRGDYLLEYTRLAPTPLEIAESVDMMRVIEHGMKVRMVPTQHASFAVDTPSDLVRVEN